MKSVAPLPPLAPARRLILQLAAWLALALAGPGILAPDGVWLLAILGVALWSTSASRPGRHAHWIEGLAAGLAWAWICGWAAHVWWGAVVYIGAGSAAYACASTWLLRRLARVAPLALAAPLAWIGVETAKALLEPPFGFPWMRLGTHLHAADWILGSARVWGVIGLGWALAAAGGFAGDALLAMRGGEAKLGRSAWLAGAPLAAGALLARVVPAPQTIDGPRVLLVQPGIPQARKMESRGGDELFREGLLRTQEGLARARAAAEAEPDLVCWGETMLGLPIMEPGLAEAVEGGARPDPWTPLEVDVEWVDSWLDVEDNFVGEGLFGAGPRAALLPEGASFLAGAETLTARDGRIRRRNSVVLWNARGERAGIAAKLHLVPGAETLVGLERYGFARTAIGALAGYVPDLLAADEVGVLALETRDGRRFRIGASVCFDNAFDDPYTEPLRRGGVDFHVLVSNEAWYLESHEVDQMMAFSHVAAALSGRALVRATNSGASAVVGPDGREVARLVVDGRDREVAGALAATVPVPADGGGDTFYVRSERLWHLAALAAPLAALAWSLRRSNPRRAAGSPASAVAGRASVP